jgi:hypothetical protein
MRDFPNYRDDALQRPQVRGEAPCGRPAEQRGLQALQGGGVQAGLPAGAAGSAQTGRAVRPPRVVPSAGRLAGYAQFADDVRLPLATGKQLRRALPARFQGCEIPSGAKSGRHERIVAGTRVDVTILRKHH